MIRPSVRQLVDLCLYISTVDAGGAEGQHTESFRKAQWRRRREAERTTDVSLTISVDESSLPLKAECTDASSASVETDGEDKETTDDLMEDEEPHINGSHGLLSVSEFLEELVASEVNVRNIRCLEAKASDPLAATSIPSRREGYSLALCYTDASARFLVVFGGRLLRDVTNLLPVASSVIDPLKLERVRYVFSNAVYTYDLYSSVWTLHTTHGKPPKARSDHSATFIKPHMMMVFGGRGKSGHVFNDMYVLSLQEWRWTELDTRTRPSPRYWHGSCLAGDGLLYMFGGKSETDVYGDLQTFSVTEAVGRMLRNQEEHAKAERTPPPEALALRLSWMAPHTVGKPPGSRFGLRVLRIDRDRIAFVGGWRSHPRKSTPRPVRSLNVHILDITTLVWTKPRFPSHICHMSAPAERFNFECFYSQSSLVVYGGFTYATDGDTESYTARTDDCHIIYKLDVHRMIWRRQATSSGDNGELLATEFPHFSSNASLSRGPTCTGFSCRAAADSPHLDVVALDIARNHSESRGPPDTPAT